MPEKKQRHGCLAAYLVAKFIVLLFGGMSCLFFSTLLKKELPRVSDWMIWSVILHAALNIICVIALFQWRKWGFWGTCILALIAFFINLAIGLTITQSLGGLTGIILLYGVLHIGGKHNKGWPQFD